MKMSAHEAAFVRMNAYEVVVWRGSVTINRRQTLGYDSEGGLQANTEDPEALVRIANACDAVSDAILELDELLEGLGGENG